MAALGVRSTSAESEVLRLMAGSKSVATAGDRVDRSSTQQQKLQGLFVRPCQQYGKTPAGEAISEFDTRRYNSCFGAEACTYELDRTYYVGDAHCIPNASDVYYKLNLHGNITYHGENEVVPNTYKASMHWVGATIYVNKGGQYQYIIDVLKSCCPTVAWASDEWISIADGDCKPVSTNADNVCNLVSGATDYFNYAWVDPLHYVTSQDDFNSVAGYSNKIDYSYTREKIEESGNNNPEDCKLPLWADCETGIIQAEKNCGSCGASVNSTFSNLECEGCLFRELNPDGTWDPNSMDNNWHKCCPCVAHYADNVDNNWLRHSVAHC